MAALDWDSTPRVVDGGLDRGVLYPPGSVPGVAWNGLVSVTEKPVTTLDTALYFDGNRTMVGQQVGTFEATLEALMYPPEFDPLIGHRENFYAHQGQGRPFGLCYRTSNTKLHLVYNATAVLNPRMLKTRDADVEISNFLFDISTRPVPVPDSVPSAHLVLDLEQIDPEARASIEETLYGSPFRDPYLPGVNEMLIMLEDFSTVFVQNFSDGSWRVDGPDDLVEMTSPTEYRITSPGLIFISEDTFRISTW